jgi:hypothetical protein
MIGRTKRTQNENEPLSASDFGNNDLERELEEYTRSAVGKVQFAVVAKAGIISFIALIFSFFLDLSYVPILGNVTIDLARALFPGGNRLPASLNLTDSGGCLWLHMQFLCFLHTELIRSLSLK